MHVPWLFSHSAMTSDTPILQAPFDDGVKLTTGEPLYETAIIIIVMFPDQRLQIVDGTCVSVCRKITHLACKRLR